MIVTNRDSRAYLALGPQPHAVREGGALYVPVRQRAVEGTVKVSFGEFKVSHEDEVRFDNPQDELRGYYYRIEETLKG